MVSGSVSGVRDVLRAYREVMTTSWADVHRGLVGSAEGWPQASEAALRAELAGYLRDAAQPPREIRVFWKHAPDLVYAGANAPFARDAGFPSAEEMLGRTDFDDQIPWTRQAAKYQSDDREVMASGKPKLDILERQEREDGVFWLHTGKAPILASDGSAVGLLGVYETIDASRALAIRRRTEQL